MAEAKTKGDGIRRYVLHLSDNDGRVYAYLCAYHAPVAGGSYKDEDHDGDVLSMTSHGVSDHERANFGADECDCCFGYCSVGHVPAPKDPR